MPTDTSVPPSYPLAGWAERHVAMLADRTGSSALAILSGAALLVERAATNGFRVPGPVSAGGGCRLLACRDGWVALNLARDDDRPLLPALFLDETLGPMSDEAVAAAMAGWDARTLVARGREMGLALAAIDEEAGPPLSSLCRGIDRKPPIDRSPLVIDLSALWAGPLAGHLLWLAGAQVVKVESRSRPDRMRDGDPALFALLNQGKANVALDLTDEADRAALIALIARADIVIEAARPRALRQLGIDAEALVRSVAGLVWVTITGHGGAGEPADWVGFGDDCSVAGGLSAALRDMTGTIGFGGDAIADPLTGILAAETAWERWASGKGGRLALSMSGVVRAAIAEERQHDGAGFEATLRGWAASEGRPITTMSPRAPTAPVSALGADTAEWLVPC